MDFIALKVCLISILLFCSEGGAAGMDFMV